MEAVAALCLQFCWGEDLMMFYWGTLTLVQCGSFIALLGLNTSLLQNCRHPHHPSAPWAMALGTPVPVICGIAHYIQNFLKYGHNNEQEIVTSLNTASQISMANRGRPLSTATETELVQMYRVDGLPEGAEIVCELADDLGFLVKIPRTAVYAVSANGTSPSQERTVAERPSQDARNPS